MAFLPITSRPFSVTFSTKNLSSPMEKEGKASSECSVKEIRVPWYPIVSIVNVRVGIVPNPVQKINGNYVVR